MNCYHCPNCNKVTGHKRALGIGTLFIVFLTAGFWLLFIPLYPKRCIICGDEESESGPLAIITVVIAIFLAFIVFVEISKNMP